MMDLTKPFSNVGAVVIGRNEGERLITCLRSLKSQIEHIVYVDSGSTDDSIQLSQAIGIETIDLDLSIPFTAARARNEGAKQLMNSHGNIEFIQFVDGDCEVQKDWISVAVNFLEKNKEYAVACGRRRERHPERSIYNTLCDIEWNTPIGDALSCGGDALIRVSAFSEIGGYDSSLIAGEEPEMCFRLRAKQWKIVRLDKEMTLHDAAMTKFFQWWKRAQRAGFAYTSGFAIHGKSAEQFKKKEVLSLVFWGGFWPLLIVLLSVINFWFISLFLIYPFQVLRIGLRDTVIKVREPQHSFLYALSSVIAKFPQFLGFIGFYKNKFKGQRASIIEYK